MKPKKLVLIALTAILLNSCNFSFSKKTDLSVKAKTINGVRYFFSNNTECLDYKVLFLKQSSVKNKVFFTGMRPPIDKVITKKDFEKKTDLTNMDFFVVDSVSFTVSENLEEVDLIYFLNLGNEKKTVTMRLEKEGQDWKLN